MYSVLITGAASGIGAGLAIELARAGHHIVVSDLRIEQAQAVTAQSLRAAGARLRPLPRRHRRRERERGAFLLVSAGRRARQQRWPAARRKVGRVSHEQVGLPGAGHADGRDSYDPGGAARFARARLRANRQYRQHPLAGGEPVQERLRRRQARLWSAFPRPSRWRPQTSTSPSTQSARAT